MAYDIFYYRRTDDGSYRQLPDLDKVGELPAAPAIGDKEIAHAINTTDQTLSRFGYAGAWRETPPTDWE